MSLGPQGGGRGCEVCGTQGPDIVELRLEVRIVSLCRRHAAKARESGVRTFSDLRRIFVESGGNRSLLARRGHEARKELTARGEGRRLQPGRRKDDSPKR